MTTTITVKNPAHANWRVEVSAQEGGKEVEAVTLDPNSEREFTIWTGRTLIINEVPLAAEAAGDEKPEGTHSDD